MLTRILRFSRHTPGGAGAQPRWRSAWPLSDAEAQFVEEVLVHREQKLQRGEQYDDLVPIPPGLVDVGGRLLLLCRTLRAY